MFDTSLEELISKIREFLGGLESEEIKQLTRKEFIEATGVNPLNISSKYRKELARILYHEFNIPYRKICELLAMSMRDVSRAIRGGASSKKTAKRSRVIEIDVELQAKAIELVRSGEARNPNDLVLKLKIPLESAEQLFNKVVENEGITIVSVLEAVRELDERIKEAEEFKDMLTDLIYDIENKSAELRELLKRSENLAEKLEKYSRELERQGVKLEKLPDLLSLIRQLEKKIVDQEKKIRDLENLVIPYVKAVKELLNRTTQLENEYSDLRRKFVEIKRFIKLFEIGLNRRFTFEEYKCKFMDKEGYCTTFIFLEPLPYVSGIKAVIREGKVNYYINVENNKPICASCPSYEPQGIQLSEYSIRSKV
uniref:Uncharacterized protein n=1 Tax=Ignisphaera aggregans TaxID=334771 RepID=A0A7J3YU03_9CREN